MADWDPFADPADTEPAPSPAPSPAPKAAAPPRPAPAPEIDPPEGPSLEGLEALQRELEVKALQRCPELVEATFAGDALKVQELLAAGADPNSIFLREERIKGSDGCCSCAISWEEYTALIAACMDSKTEKICELLLAHAAIDLNVVCCGLHEFGPYKHFTVRDVARQAKSPLLSRLVAAGALPAAQCAQPPWPREGEEVQEAPLPALPPGRAQKAAAQLLEAMRGHRSKPLSERSRLFKQMMLEWHPDKRPAERAIATEVCQWLLGPARCFVA